MEKPLFSSTDWKTQERSVRDIYVQAQKLRAQKKKEKEKKKKKRARAVECSIPQPWAPMSVP